MLDYIMLFGVSIVTFALGYTIANYVPSSVANSTYLMTVDI